MNIVKIIVGLLAILAIALVIEKLLHKSFTLKQVVEQLKIDVTTVAKALFSEPQIRHTFFPELSVDLRAVAEPYSLPSFDIDVGNYMDRGTPTVVINFVPHKNLSVDELNEVSSLLLLKFRRYLIIHNLNWKTFAVYKSFNGYIFVYLYYAEMQEDIAAFNYNHQQAIKEKSDVDYGTLQDDGLNKELDNVN